MAINEIEDFRMDKVIKKNIWYLIYSQSISNYLSNYCSSKLRERLYNIVSLLLVVDESLKFLKGSGDLFGYDLVF